MQAEDYAGDGMVYSKTVSIDDVAWINTDEGQFVKNRKDKAEKAPLRFQFIGKQGAEESTSGEDTKNHPEARSKFQSDASIGDVASSSKGAPTVILPKTNETDAKIANRTAKAKNNIKKIKNGDYKLDNLTSFSNFRKELSGALNLRYKGQGAYGILDIKDGRLEIRFNNHNANGANFKDSNASEIVSIYVNYKQFPFAENNIGFTEFQ